jgi:tRNA U34 5-carboxymethylaminomethyl modifying enzyme MnmG/GidA
MGHKRDRNKVVDIPTEPINIKESLLTQLRTNGFDTSGMTEYELALLSILGVAKAEIVEAIDELGAMLEDVMTEEEGG